MSSRKALSCERSTAGSDVAIHIYVILDAFWIASLRSQ